MPSEIDVVNYAMVKIGQNPITSFEDGSKAATTAKLVYPLARASFQRMFPWRSCKARAQLAASTTAPTWGYAFAYPMPADNLRVIDVFSGDYRLGNSDGPFPRSEWIYEAGSILTDIEGPINVIYLREVTDPNAWDSLMVQAMSAFLAMDLAEAFTNSAQKKAQASQWFREAMAVAKNASSQEGTPAIINPDSKWEQARYDGRSNL